MQTEIVRCEACKNELPKGESQAFTTRVYVENRYQEQVELYCKACFEQRFIRCQNCAEFIPKTDALHDENRQPFCEDCYHDIYTSCAGCSCELYANDALFDDDGNPYCEECYPAHRERGAIRQMVPKAKVPRRESLQLFGIEVEAILSGSSDYEDYEILNYFSVVPDGSLSSGGMEFVTVPLPANRRGYKLLHDFAHTYAKANLCVDKSCGLHLHINIREEDLTLKNLKKLWLAYLKLEPYFFSIVPVSRRNNSFCRSLNGDYSIEKIRKFRNECRLLGYYYDEKIRQKDLIPKEKYHSKRYYWVNLNSLFYRGTLEIRLHSGTISSRKMVYWAMLHRRLLKWVLNPKTTVQDVLCLNRKKLLAILKDRKLKKHFLEREAKFQPHYSVEELFTMFN